MNLVNPETTLRLPHYRTPANPQEGGACPALPRTSVGAAVDDPSFNPLSTERRSEDEP